MNQLDRIMLAGDPGAGVLPTPKPVKDDRVRAILAADDLSTRFEGTPPRRRRKQWWLLLLAAVVTAALITTSVVSGQRNSIPVLSPEPEPTLALTAAELLVKAADAQTDSKTAPAGKWLEEIHLMAQSSTPDQSDWTVLSESRSYYAGDDSGLFCAQDLLVSDYASSTGQKARNFCTKSNEPVGDPSVYDEFPRDVEGLHEYFLQQQALADDYRSDNPSGRKSPPTQEESLFINVAYFLVGGSPEPPAELRSVMLRYLAEKTNAVITDSSLALPSGTGVGIGLPDSDPSDPNLVFDPATGELLGRYNHQADGTRTLISETSQVVDVLPPELITLACQSKDEGIGNHCPEG